MSLFTVEIPGVDGLIHTFAETAEDAVLEALDFAGVGDRPDGIVVNNCSRGAY